MTKNYVVTGAAGFIGAAVAHALIQRGDKVIAIDNLSTGFRNNIPKEARFIEGDCQNQDVLDQLQTESIDCIYHIAGQSSGEISFDDPVYDLQTNGQSTLQLLQLCRDINCQKLIYASTMSVYGDVPNKAISEDRIPAPKSFYAVGKLASEHYLQIYAREFGIQTAALRLFNVYGPGQNLTNMRQGMVSIFLAQALSDKKIHVKGAKDRFRDFVYIEDVVKAFIRTEARLKNNDFLLCNISSGRRTTVEELVNTIRNNFNIDIPVKYEGRTPGDQYGIYGDGSRAKRWLDWQATMNFENGIQEMVRWAQKQNL